MTRTRGSSLELVVEVNLASDKLREAGDRVRIIIVTMAYWCHNDGGGRDKLNVWATGAHNGGRREPWGTVGVPAALDCT